mmetsp:Transcript_60079/g.168420  ORF Transcript_60079/g.168420 Transcript_60079/m.168420 type:complete len:301 (-) Transcript_60079:1467-2369(-)
MGCPAAAAYAGATEGHAPADAPTVTDASTPAGVSSAAAGAPAASAADASAAVAADVFAAAGGATHADAAADASKPAGAGATADVAAPAGATDAAHAPASTVRRTWRSRAWPAAGHQPAVGCGEPGGAARATAAGAAGAAERCGRARQRRPVGASRHRARSEGVHCSWGRQQRAVAFYELVAACRHRRLWQHPGRRLRLRDAQVAARTSRAAWGFRCCCRRIPGADAALGGREHIVREGFVALGRHDGQRRAAHERLDGSRATSLGEPPHGELVLLFFFTQKDAARLQPRLRRPWRQQRHR